MPGLTVSIRGMDSLERGLRELAENVSGRTGKAAVTRTLVAAGQKLTTRMAEKAPKARGKLRKSLGVVSSPAQVKAGLRAAGKRAGLNSKDALAAANTFLSDGAAVVVLVGPNKKTSAEASQVEFGTKPHEIHPKAGHKVLPIWAGGGIEGFAPDVQHPGARPQPFMRPAVEELASELQEDIKAGLKEQLAKATARAAAKAR